MSEINRLQAEADSENRLLQQAVIDFANGQISADDLHAYRMSAADAERAVANAVAEEIQNRHGGK